MAVFGHSGSHAPQLMHSLVITVAIHRTSPRILQSRTIPTRASARKRATLGARAARPLGAVCVRAQDAAEPAALPASTAHATLLLLDETRYPCQPARRFA